MSNYIKFWHTGEQLSPMSTSKIKAIQESMNILDDGLMGEHTLDRIYREYAKPEECYDDHFYNAYVITGHPSTLQAGVLNGSALPINSISGTFNYNGNPSAGLGYNGEKFHTGSAHAWADKPDTFIFVKDGIVQAKRAVYFNESCDFFVSGMGLHNWNPGLEGYGKFTHKGKPYDYRDVHRKTWHNAIGVYHDGYVVLAFFYGTSEQLRVLMIELLKCKFAAMLDGGHYFGGINSPRYKKRHQNKQNNYIGFKW